MASWTAFSKAISKKESGLVHSFTVHLSGELLSGTDTTHKLVTLLLLSKKSRRVEMIINPSVAKSKGRREVSQKCQAKKSIDIDKILGYGRYDCSESANGARRRPFDLSIGSLISKVALPRMKVAQCRPKDTAATSSASTVACSLGV